MLKTTSCLTLFLLFMPQGWVSAQESKPHAIEPTEIGRVERLDPAIDDLIATGTKIEAVADGFEWSEGPVWLEKKRCVVFSDVPTNTVYSWSESGGLTVYLQPSGYTGFVPGSGRQGSNGLAVDHQGRLILCQHGDRRLARMNATQLDPKADYITLVNNYMGMRFHSPNDLAIHSNGTIFFTDPPYGLPGQLKNPQRELGFQGVYKVNPSEQTNLKATLLVKDLPRPNGIALSHDEKKLYVAQSHRPDKIIMVYELNDQLELTNGRLFFDANESRKNKARQSGWAQSRSPRQPVCYRSRRCPCD